MYPSARDILFIVLFLLWSLLLWRHCSQPTHPAPMAPYNFSAKTPIRSGKTTVLQFAAPSPPHYNDAVMPTILRTLDALNVVEPRARYEHASTYGGVALTAPRSSSTLDGARAQELAPILHDEKPRGILKSEPDLRTSSMRFSPSPSRRSVLYIEPIPHHHARVEQTLSRSTPMSDAGIIRSGSRASMTPAGQTAASPRELSRRSPSIAPVRRSSSTTSVGGEVPSDDDSGSEFNVRYANILLLYTP